ncbi:SusD/RagB family nutrient-binding outer membrane lipoprotein [Prevotella sp. 10(H)]|uniref:SusD/RagB family nutrient-binding outer membrane lipoprotein n=1 Tax=Prevotella sp. 10(H) TaxID=1158294 RepID=UPI0004A7498E|nr:SusD/RagB family nutrient-binding outer membrane lipoprotein [Prevotella sp. 10(H)]
MKKYYSYLLILLLIQLAGCSEFEKINNNPDATIKVKPSLLVLGQLTDMMYKSGGKDYVDYTTVPKQIFVAEKLEDLYYNRFWRTGFGAYESLTNSLKMVELAEEIDKDAYEALSKFIIAYRLYDISMYLGDIPYSDALKGETGTVKPKYDTQKDVMKQILDDLDKSYALFSNKKGTIEGDFVYNGNFDKWKKAISVMQLRVLMNMSKKESDTDMNIKQRFAKIVAEQSLMESNDDNLQLVYGTESSMICPLFKNKNVFTKYYVISDFIINMLRDYDDYRLFYYGKPAPVKLEQGYKEDEWEAYPGTNPVAPFDEIKSKQTTEDYTCINLRYTEIETAEPLIRLGYALQNFILAEACLRKWITGNANDYYLKGIRASMEFIVKHTPDETRFHHGRMMTDAYINNYLSNPDIQLSLTSASFEDDLKKIITQKYLASFIQHPWESYYDYRRTGYPVIPINPKTNLNTDPNKMPMRWMYDQRELDYNRESVDEALKRQFGGSDDVNALMWILK